VNLRPLQSWADRLGDVHARRQSAPLLAFVAALAIGGWLWAHRDLPPLLWSGDGYEYADIGRHLAAGEGFTTGIVYPPHLAYGVARDHPSLVRPPLWPVVLGAAFALAGPSLAAVHSSAALLFVATAVLAAALATRVGGRAAGAVAGIAAATSPQLQLLALGGLSETCFALVVTGAFLLFARQVRPVWIGATCGLAYLTRYDGIALAAVLGLALTLGPGRQRALAAFAAGFAVVALPWWLRNWLVTGDPFYALTSLNLYMAPGLRGQQHSLIYQVEPDLASEVAVHPLAKARLQLPLLLRYWPPASANLAACVGVAVACVRRERTSLAFAALALATTVGIAFAMALGRYFVPLLPVLLALGAAGWLRFGGRLGAAALALLLAAPLLPAFPRQAPDLGWTRLRVEGIRAIARGEAPGSADWTGAVGAERCLSPRTLLVGQLVSPLVWHTGTLAIHFPAEREEFWRIVEEYPVDFVQLRNPKRVSAERFARRFAPRRDCGEDLYERRDRTP
jgi:4-amino-4-deoxy-L-arabinose transferase-like glycosyltransferase